MAPVILWWTVLWQPLNYPFFLVKTGAQGAEQPYAIYQNPVSNILVPLALGACVSVTPVDANNVPVAQTAEWCSPPKILDAPSNVAPAPKSPTSATNVKPR